MWYSLTVYPYFSGNQLPLLCESRRRITLDAWIILDYESRISKALCCHGATDMSSLVGEEKIVIPEGLEIIVFRLRERTHLIIEVRTLERRFRGSSEGIIRDDCPVDIELIRA